MIFTVNYPGVGAIAVVGGGDYFEFSFYNVNHNFHQVIRFTPSGGAFMVFGLTYDTPTGNPDEYRHRVYDFQCYSKTDDDSTAQYNQTIITDGVITGNYDNYMRDFSTLTTPDGLVVRTKGATVGDSSLQRDEGVINITNSYDEVHDASSTATASGILADLIFAHHAEDDDPYTDLGDNEVEGGGGDFDDTSVDVDFPPVPQISVSDAGFVTILTPTLTQIQALSNYLWSTAFDVTQVKKLFANPMDVFIGLSILPIAVPSSSTKTLTIAGINTGLVMNLADQQFVDVDFGTLTIKTGTGGSYLDYSPYTKASIFLPYIGWRDIDIDEIMGKTLQLKYRVDIVSGGCVAWLKCGGSVLYEWTGQCAVNIPLTSIDFTSTVSAAISAVGHIGSALGGMVSGGMNGGMAGASIGPVGAIAGAIGGGIGGAINGVAGLASDALSAKPTYPKSGSLGGPAGVMGHQMAYICLHRPAMAKPKDQGKYMGYPSYITRKISDLYGTGFNAFADVKLQGLGLLDTEIAELTTILKGGVYL